jgi:hypothetical protein
MAFRNPWLYINNKNLIRFYIIVKPNWTHFDRTTTVNILKQKGEGVGNFLAVYSSTQKYL